MAALSRASLISIRIWVSAAATAPASWPLMRAGAGSLNRHPGDTGHIAGQLIEVVLLGHEPVEHDPQGTELIDDAVLGDFPCRLLNQAVDVGDAESLKTSRIEALFIRCRRGIEIGIGQA